jgi:hypothetical protein
MSVSATSTQIKALGNRTGAPGSPQRTWAENDCFKCFHSAGSTVLSLKNKVGLPPDFLWSLLALANLMRLSLLKAAHAKLFGAACRKSGSPIFFNPGTLGRTWGTRRVCDTRPVCDTCTVADTLARFTR